MVRAALENQGTVKGGRIMGLQRIVRRNGTRPLDRVRGGAYPTSRNRRRAVRIAPHADAGKVGRSATSAQAPLRPSEGLLVPCAGKACPPQWRTPGLRAREYTGWASRETWGPLMGTTLVEAGEEGQSARQRSEAAR